MNAPPSVLDHLQSLGLGPTETVYYNLAPARLYEIALRRGEGRLAQHGPLVTRTDPHTGRSPHDRFIVREPSSEDEVGWGDVNRPIAEDSFDRLLKGMGRYTTGRDLFVRDCYAGADPRYRVKVRVITELAWHQIFIYNMFLHPADGEAVGEDFQPDYTVLDLPGYKAKSVEDLGLNSSTFILVHLGRGQVIIGGTHYAGEMKKSIFGALNYVLPAQGVLPMHCSANVGDDGESAVFFGLSGTGKTTLSADASRTLIGDDEHGWSDDGIFNFEGGCYAKAIKLSPESEPEIYGTTRRFGTLAENVILDDQRAIDFDAATITENTRLSYPIWMIPNASETGMGPHPKTVMMLTADAYGILPPIAKLTPEQAMYHFLSGYTAKVAGTERGVTEPKATFSACFGEPFMVRPPSVYAEMLGEKIRQHGAQVFLVNTGWTGGPYGTGQRMKLAHTRRMVNAALDGELDGVETTTDPIFGLAIPTHVEGVPDEVLNPRTTWADKEAYDRKARELAGMFARNFEKYAANVPAAVLDAGPTAAQTA